MGGVRSSFQPRDLCVGAPAYKLDWNRSPMSIVGAYFKFTGTM